MSFDRHSRETVREISTDVRTLSKVDASVPHSLKVSSGSSGGDERRSVVLVPKKASKRKASSKSRNTGLLAPNESSADGHSMEGTDWDDRRVSSSSGTPKRLSTGGNGKVGVTLHIDCKDVPSQSRAASFVVTDEAQSSAS